MPWVVRKDPERETGGRAKRCSHAKKPVKNTDLIKIKTDGGSIELPSVNFYNLDNALSHHCICNLDEACDVCACYKVIAQTVFL